MSSSPTSDRIGIVISGGPAPGINSAISACTIEALNRGYKVFGIADGFEGIATQGPKALLPLTIESVSRIRPLGGSILGTARFNPLLDERRASTFLQALQTLQIQRLIVIGGEGSAFVSHQLSQRHPSLRIVHVPKTIDNDLLLPHGHPCFGFETARQVGTNTLTTLMEDARTSRRWFLVTSMGRRAGFLALGLGSASAATLTLIPEEFKNGSTRPEEVVSILAASMRKRLAIGKSYGVAILAEGVLDTLDPTSHPLLASCPRDELGRLRYNELELGDILRPLLRTELGSLPITITAKNIGYELRCHAPSSFDIEYTSFLGFAAVEAHSRGLAGVMVARDIDRIAFVPLAEMVGADGKIRSRTVDLNSDAYRVARSFMIR